MDLARLLELTRRFLARAVTADFQRGRAADDERNALAALPVPVTDPLAQDYLAWRRSVLWLGGVLLVLGCILAIADHESIAAVMAASQMPAGHVPTADELAQGTAQMVEALGKANVALVDDLQYFHLLLKVGVAALVVWAAVIWLQVGRSRTLSRWAWLAALLVPLLVSAWPWAKSLDFSHLDQQGGNGQAVKQTFALMFAASSLATVGPKLLALFPGIMRSSLTLKTLLPEAAAPGWLTVVFAPFLAGFLMLVLCLLSQVEGSFVLIAATALLVVGPCVYVRRARDLVRPHTGSEIGTVVGGVRRTALLFHGSGALLLVVYLVDLDALPLATVVHLGLEALGGVFLTMVAISDITLALLAFGQRQGASFQASTLREDYERRLMALASAGLTDVEGALGVHDLERLRQKAPS